MEKVQRSIDPKPNDDSDTGNNSTRSPDNDDMLFQSPQNEESKRLSKLKSADPVERKDKNPDDEGEIRGGNFSVNQG